MSLATASCSGVVRNSEIRRELELDVDVECKYDETVQALVSHRMSGLNITATALAGACGGASVICTSPTRSGGVAVLARGTAGGVAATASYGASGTGSPANIYL